MQVSHFTAVLIFAACVSVVFGITQRSTTRDMVRYGLMCFGFFICGTIAASWVIALVRR